MTFLCLDLISTLLAAPSPATANIAKLTAILQSNADQKSKADACRELALVGNKEAVAALAALLPDEKLSHMARYGLETIPDPSVDQAFRDALGRLHGRPLVGVIGSIGVRRDPHAVKPLAKFLTDPDPDTVQVSARSLGKIGNPAAAKVLLTTLSNVRPENQVAVCEGLFRCAENFSATGHNKQAIAIYDRVRATPGPHQVKTAALRGSVLSRQEAGLSLLREALHHSDFAIFAAACRISQEIPGPGVTRLLADDLAKPVQDRQILVAQSLGERGDPAALPALFAAAKQGENPARLSALHAISELCQPSAVPVFVELMADKEPEIARAAQEALGALPGREADAAVLAMLKDNAPARRATGVDLVARRRMTSAIPELLKIAQCEDANLRVAAVRKLGELAGARDLPALIDLLKRANLPADTEAAEQALGVVASRAPDANTCAEALAAALAQVQSPQKCALVRVLASVGGPVALRSLRAAVKDPETQLRACAIRALGTWNNADAAPDLLELARTASDPAEKTLSLRSYIAVAGQSELTTEARCQMCRDASALAQTPEEKKLLLGALGNIYSPESVALIQPCLEDASVKEEAALACVTISEKLLQDKDSAKQAQNLVESLQKVVQAGVNPDLAKRAQSLLEQAQKKASQ